MNFPRSGVVCDADKSNCKTAVTLCNPANPREEMILLWGRVVMRERREYLEPGLEFGFQMPHSEFGA